MSEVREYRQREGGSSADRQGGELVSKASVVIQGVVLAILIWIGSSVVDLNKTAIELKVRYESADAASKRVEADVAAIRNQLATMNTSVQAFSFKIENLEQRVKGLELTKERMIR